MKKFTSKKKDKHILVTKYVINYEEKRTSSILYLKKKQKKKRNKLISFKFKISVRNKWSLDLEI